VTALSRAPLLAFVASLTCPAVLVLAWRLRPDAVSLVAGSAVQELAHG
jgi:hypothetical protein